MRSQGGSGVGVSKNLCGVSVTGVIGAIFLGCHARA